MSGPLIDQYLEHVQEEDLLDEASGTTKKTSFAKITRQTKIDRAIGSLSTQLAKANNDSWYSKMVKHRDKYFKFRKMIKQKYAPKVRSRAITGKGISDLLQNINKNKKK